MGFQKVIPVGDKGSIVISEEGMVASVKVSVAAEVGGGSVAGIAKASLSAEVDVNAMELIDAGLEMAKAKFPAVAAAIEGAKVLIDAEMAKL